MPVNLRGFVFKIVGMLFLWLDNSFCYRPVGTPALERIWFPQHTSHGGKQVDHPRRQERFAQALVLPIPATLGFGFVRCNYW